MSTIPEVVQQGVAQQGTEETFDRLVDEGEQRLGRSWLGLFGIAVLGNMLGGLGLVTVLRLPQVSNKVLDARRDSDAAPCPGDRRRRPAPAPAAGGRCSVSDDLTVHGRRDPMPGSPASS